MKLETNSTRPTPTPVLFLTDLWAPNYQPGQTWTDSICVKTAYHNINLWEMESEEAP